MSNQHSKCDDCYKTHLPEAHDRIILPSEAFGEGYVPEFNQASEDVVDSILSTLGIVDRKSGNRPDQIQVVKQIIRTEKLKLLNEVIHQSTVNLKSAKAVAGWAELRKKQLEAEL